MDWERYKAICDAPDVCSRWLLEQTLELVADPALASRLREHLEAVPLAKPSDHQGGTETDMFRMSLSLPEVCAVHRRVQQAVDAGTTTHATRERGLSGFVETWREFEDYLTRRAGGHGPQGA